MSHLRVDWRSQDSSANSTLTAVTQVDGRHYWLWVWRAPAGPGWDWSVGDNLSTIGSGQEATAAEAQRTAERFVAP